MAFPTKSEREKCWTSRDDLWKCLDENKDNSEICVKFRAMYENSCPPQWVKHFDRKREYLKFKDRIQNEGLTPPSHHLDPTSTLAPLGTNNVNDVDHSNSTSNTIKTPGSNTRIFRKFQPPTYT